jgi:hypothetical protein
MRISRTFSGFTRTDAHQHFSPPQVKEIPQDSQVFSATGRTTRNALGAESFIYGRKVGRGGRLNLPRGLRLTIRPSFQT